MRKNLSSVKCLILAAFMLMAAPSAAQGPQMSHLAGSAATATIAMVPAVAGQKVYVFGLLVSIGTPGVTVTLQDTGGTALSQPFAMAANTVVNAGVPNGGAAGGVGSMALWQSNSGLGVRLGQSGTTAVGYDIWYIQSF